MADLGWVVSVRMSALPVQRRSAVAARRQGAADTASPCPTTLLRAPGLPRLADAARRPRAVEAPQAALTFASDSRLFPTGETSPETCLRVN